MAGDNNNLVQWIVIGLLVIAVVVLGFMLKNVNDQMGLMDARIVAVNKNGQELTAWARESAKWSTHVDRMHLSHPSSGHSAPSHITPPPDPPDDWQ